MTMQDRTPELQAFLDAALAAFDAHATSGESRAALGRIRSALAEPAPLREVTPGRQPTCRWLEPALDYAAQDAGLRPMLDAFRALEPALEWSCDKPDNPTASENFTDGHAEVMIVGPGGMEPRRDVWLGLSLLAPGVRYPDHNHRPEEVYLVLSEGDFRQGDDPWFTPGLGGSFYNRPSILHAMRSGDDPLFAFWALWNEPAAA